uniref:Capsid protein n=1 Tax=Genomoviridae sp. TaxID=2202565 RepID=A0A858NF35_9VIRU|nr:MAG: capsid protein [Genomoviridae sp.]
MAYRRTKRRYPARRRPTRKSSYRSKSRRSYTGRRRVSRAPSRKRILNMTSTKKKDNMLCWTNTSPSQIVLGFTYGVGPAILTGGNTYIFPWVANYRPATDYTGGFARPVQESVRTSTVCYMRGVKEQIQIQTNTGMPWTWRRICFTLKGTALRNFATTNMWMNITNGNGPTRLMNNWATTTGGQAIVDLVFDGRTGADWDSVYAAKTDKQRISVHYDKTVTMNPGNESGYVRNFKLWHPMNKNMQYDDDESGDGESTAGYSTLNKMGMGDYYIVDIIASGTAGDSDDMLRFNPQATLYWHEK